MVTSWQVLFVTAGIDILVNNASAISLTGTLETPMKKVDLMLGINLRGTYLTYETPFSYFYVQFPKYLEEWSPLSTPPTPMINVGVPASTFYPTDSHELFILDVLDLSIAPCFYCFSSFGITHSPLSSSSSKPSAPSHHVRCASRLCCCANIHSSNSMFNSTVSLTSSFIIVGPPPPPPPV